MIVRVGKRALATLVVSLLVGCTGLPVNVAPVPPSSYSEVGHSSGEGCGMIFLWAIPISMTDRVERAYDRALERSHATSLTDTVLVESWYFALIGTVVCTTVEGLALEKSEGATPAPRAPRAEFKKNSH